MSIIWKVHNHIVKASAPKSDYEKLKTKINRTTLGYGTALTSSYFIAYGAEEGVSATLGVVSSLAYIGLLTRNVDNIEKLFTISKTVVGSRRYRRFLKQCGNNAPFGF
jgi:hypothetical protein